MRGRLDSDVDGACPHLGNRVALGLGDLLLGKRGAALDKVLGLGVGFREQRVGFALGGRHDGGGVLLGFLPLLLEFGQKLLRFLAQAAWLPSSSPRMRLARASSALAIVAGTLR